MVDDDVTDNGGVVEQPTFMSFATMVCRREFFFEMEGE